MIKIYTKAASNLSRTKGFSLIELLVVMAIIAFVTAGVSLVNGSSSAKQINRQGDLLFAQMQYAMDEALMNNTAIGLLIEQEDNDSDLSRRYRWKRDQGMDTETRERQWGEMKNYLKSGELPEDFAWEVEIEDISLEENLDRLLLSDEDKQPQPQIVFYPSGEVSAFSVLITLSEEGLEGNPDAIDERYKITLDERGELARYSVGEPDS